MSDEIECLEPEALAKWLRDKGLDEATTQKLEENMVDGNMFMNLNDGDLKDLFDAFIVRKKIRDIQMQQRELKEEEITPPKAKKMKYEQLPALPTLSEPSSSKKVAPINRALSLQPKSFDENSFNTVPIPNCAVLANPKEHSEKEVDNARVRIIRLTMDSLITKCADRPTELELIHLAKSIATQYSILRDDRGLPVRDNYVMHVKTSTSCCLCIEE
ncbi:uncharacterized protein LOC134252466 [Saccostrea cucullata]|uniref:uncharacterized protein LOC134252466 n=1 Tax=Saccostrea cuccullata TaxID=36930 RepID=UPI002ED3B7B8